MFNFIVAGANGFIGSQLVAGLRNAGYVVVSLDLFSETSIYQTLTSIAVNPESEWIVVNSSSPNEIRIRKESELGIDSLEPIYKLVDFMTTGRLTRLLHFSTVQIFGTNLEGELNMQSKIRLESPYAKIHFEIENYINNKMKKAGITTIILRLPNVFGANPKNFEKRISLVPNCFVDELLDNSKITLLSSGRQLRNFLSIDQLVHEIVHIARNGFKMSYTDICASDFYMTILDAAKICTEQYSKWFGKVGLLKINSENPLRTTRFILVSQYSGAVKRNVDSKKEFETVVGTLFKNEASKRGL